MFIGFSFLDLAGLGLIANYNVLVLQTDSIAKDWSGKMLVLMGWEPDLQTMLWWFRGVLVSLLVGKEIVVLLINDSRQGVTTLERTDNDFTYP